MPTQKYKQQTQQVRVITNESGYANGMFYTDVPLSEGYAKVLLNLDIDSATGKLTPRKGLQSEGVVRCALHATGMVAGDTRNIIAYSKVAYKYLDTVAGPLQTIIYNTDKKRYALLTCKPEYKQNMNADGETFSLTGIIAMHYISRPIFPRFTIEPAVHKQRTVHDDFFIKPIGTFAFEDSYYTFLETCFKPADGEPVPIAQDLCYTKFVKDLQPEEEKITDDGQIALCKCTPVQYSPTQAASWGYNMLLENPYEFVCESTAANLVSITGIIPYDAKTDEPVLTPRKNQEVVLKGYYRAPEKYISDLINGRYYPTKKNTALTELVGKADADLTEYAFGEWCIYSGDANNIGGYYMVMPAGNLNTKKLALWGDTYQPEASVKLNVLPESTEETKIRVRWQMKTGVSATWTDLYNEQFTLTEYNNTHGKLTPFMVKTNLPDSEVLVRLTVSDPMDTVSTEEYILSTNTIGITTLTDDKQNTANLAPAKYALHTCKGMLEWEQRLVLWGVENAYNMIFVSDVNNPGYFPYPNNIDIFPDPVVSVHSYGNELLVVTTTSLYRLTWSAEGAGWTHTLIQKNLHIREEDVPLSVVIKNMFFFKSNNYYYMLVPKTSSTGIAGDTTIAPISKPIENLLDNFHEIVYNLIKDIVDTPGLQDFTKYLVNYFSYTDNTRVVVNYVYDLSCTETTIDSITDSKYLYVQLLYDTDTRTWSMRTFEAPHMLFVSHADTLQQDHFIDLTPYTLTGFAPVPAIQFYKLQDVQDNTIQYLHDRTPVYSTKLIKNYQYIDTGNREINTELKKRFREFQFKLKNTSLINLHLHNAFYIDGSPRRELQSYVPLVEQTATGENIIIVDRYVDGGELHPTTLAKNDATLPCWTLNQSAFPGRTLWKIRIPIMGKGYSPRAILVSKNEAQFELLGHSWVYRTMNAR